MKKSQLRKIIRESLKELKGKKQPLNEMKCGCDVPNNPQAYTIKQCASCDENCCTGAFELSKQDNIMAPTLSPGKKLINKKSSTEQNPNQEDFSISDLEKERDSLLGEGEMNEQSNNCPPCQDSNNDIHWGAMATLTNTPQLGTHGINQNFINNMQGKPTQFYQARANTLADKIIDLAKLHTCPEQRPPYNLLVCKGYNPMWQAALINKKKYVQLCSQNPGSC